MNFVSATSLDKRNNADLLVLPFWQGKKGAEAAVSLGNIKTAATGPVTAGDFKGKQGESAVVYPSKQKEKRWLLLGLGKKTDCSVETLRRAYSQVAKVCQSKRFEKINVLMPDALSDVEVARGVSEGLLLPNYHFNHHKEKQSKDDETILITKCTLIGCSPAGMKEAKRCDKVCDAVYFARDLVNGNADDVTPQFFGKVAKDMAKQFTRVKATVFDKKRLEKEKMGLILAVGRAAHHEPTLVILEYKGNPKSKDHTVVVGKGVTFDTGGLNLKPTGSMETMKCDMGGAAAALGTFYAIAKLGLKVNVTAVVPSVENAMGALSYKPGDVYKSYLGKSVEIGNTDAEGRLILADALAYAQKKLKPTRIIDLATLTGACVIALGEEATGLMSNDDGLAKGIIGAGERTFERCWQLPVFEEYKEKLKSDIADLRNIGGRAAGTITAGIFLQQFVGDTPWAHLDIAATAYLDKPLRYQPKHATGVGVRLLVDFIENL